MGTLEGIEQDITVDMALSKAKPCQVEQALRGLDDPADAATLTRLVHDDEYAASIVARRLAERDIVVKDWTIRRHRIGGCEWCNLKAQHDG